MKVYTSTMNKTEYSEMFDCLTKLNEALVHLLRMNWNKHPWAKDKYDKMAVIYEELRAIVFPKMQESEEH